MSDQVHGNLLCKTGAFSAGLLLGGLIGSGAMLLLAPQSGKKTRAQIQHESIELRDQVTETVDGAVTQARGKTRQITTAVRKQAKKLEQQGQDMLDEQKEVVSQVVEAEKKMVAHNGATG